MKTLASLKTEKRLNTNQKMKDFLTGKTLTVVGNAANHNKDIGTKLTIGAGTSFVSNNSSFSYPYLDGKKIGLTFYYEDVSVEYEISADALKAQVESLTADKKRITEEIAEAKSKLAFLKETGVERFSETEYKTYMVMEKLEDEKLTKLERAKAIAKLIDG